MDLAENVLTEIDAAIHASVATAFARNYKSRFAMAVSWNKVSFFSGDPGYTPYPVRWYIYTSSH